MARAISWLALIVAYAATVLFLAAMVTPWWYAKYYAVNESNNSFYDNNPGLDQHTGLFHMTNCFIDGSCITGGTIYKNNSSLQWVYTAVIVLMLVAWVPWLYFVHLLHWRANKNRVVGAANRPLMLISAFLALALIIAAVIVFAVGMVYTNGTYNYGLYGHRQVTGNGAGFTGVGQNVNDDFKGTNGHNDKRQASNTTSTDNSTLSSDNYGFNGVYDGIIPPVYFGSLPFGNQSYTLLGAGISLIPAGNAFGSLVGVIGYKWGAHCAWYCALFTLPLILLALILGLAIKTEKKTVTTTRTTERVVTTQPAVIPQGGYIPQPAYSGTQASAAL